jgi:hypothetical protein
MRQSISTKWRTAVLTLGVLALAAGTIAPAFAQERHEWRDRGRGHERHYRGDRDWNRGGGGGYFGPSYGYYGYAPPPVIYPEPGFSINIPLDIR